MVGENFQFSGSEMAKTTLKTFSEKGINTKDSLTISAQYDIWNEIFVRSDNEEFQDISRTNAKSNPFSRTFKDIPGQMAKFQDFQDFQDVWLLWVKT